MLKNIETMAVQTAFLACLLSLPLQPALGQNSEQTWTGPKMRIAVMNLTRLFFNKGNSETRSKCLLLLVTPRIIIQEEE